MRVVAIALAAVVASASHPRHVAAQVAPSAQPSPSTPPAITPRAPAPQPPEHFELHQTQRSPGEPPAFRLSHDLEPVSYRVRLAIHERSFTGFIDITADLSRPSAVLWLHDSGLWIKQATATRGSTSIDLGAQAFPDQQLVALLADNELPAGRWTISIVYSGAFREYEGQVNDSRYYGGRHDRPAIGAFRREVDGRNYYFTMSEPIYARTIYPCIDEPDRKVPWELAFDVPRDAIALGNAPVARETVLDADRKRIELAPTLPIPSYLVAFAIGPLDTLDIGRARSGAPIRVIFPHGHAPASWVAQTAPRILGLLEDWLGIPYPYPKLDLVAMPHAVLGMENPGLITFDETLLQSDRSLWVMVAAHEFAHQWFGDLVTPKWWNDIWLNESFATWMAERVNSDGSALRTRDPAEQARVALLHGVRPKFADNAALDFDAFQRAYDSDSGAAGLSVIENEIGTAALWHALHRYLVEHAHGVVSTQDLVSAIAAESHRPELGPALQRVIDVGRPHVDMQVSCNGSRRDIEMTSIATAKSPIRVCFAFDRDGEREDKCMSLDGPRVRVPITVRACPKWVLPAAGAAQLYIGITSEANRGSLAAAAWPQLTADERRALFVEDDLPDQLAMVPKLLRDGDPRGRRLASRTLIDIRDSLSHELRGSVDTFVVATIGSAVGHSDFGTAGEDLPLVELVAKAGDARLVRDAVARAQRFAELEDDIRSAVLKVAVNDPTTARRLFTAVTKYAGRTMLHWQLVDAIARAADLPGTIRANRSAFLALDDEDRTHILSSACDSNVQSQLEQLDIGLTAHENASNFYARRCERIASAIRGWLGNQ